MFPSDGNGDHNLPEMLTLGVVNEAETNFTALSREHFQVPIVQTFRGDISGENALESNFSRHLRRVIAKSHFRRLGGSHSGGSMGFVTPRTAV